MSQPADTTRTDEAGAPLSGRSVLVTRTREQARALAEPLEALGAEVLAFPVIEVVDPQGADLEALDSAIRDIERYDWIVLTSTNGVDRFFARAVFVDRSAEALSRVKLAAVGSATAARMRSFGVEPDFVPKDFRAEGLIDGFRELGVGKGARILIPRALEAREILPEQLRDMGAEVEVVVTYRVVPAAPDPAIAARLAEGSVDVLTLASGHTFRCFLDALDAAGLDRGVVMAHLSVASVGPVTSDAVRALGYPVDIEAAESTMGSLAEAIAAHYTDCAEG